MAELRRVSSPLREEVVGRGLVARFARSGPGDSPAAKGLRQLETPKKAPRRRLIRSGFVAY